MFKAAIDMTSFDRAIGVEERALRHPAYLKTVGNSMAKRVKANARAKANGGRFWLEIAAATRVQQVTPFEVIVSCDHYAAAQKQYGGTIRARNARALTIPLCSESRGKRASEFLRDLFVVKTRLGGFATKGVLGYADEDGDFHALYLLRTQVTQKADPFWPEDAEIDHICQKEAEFWSRRLERAG